MNYHHAIATFLVVSVLGFGAGCATGGGAEHSDADSRDAVKTLMKLDDEWSASAVTRDAERVASYYAVDAIVYPPNERAVRGRDAAKKVWAGYFAEPSFQISWKVNDAHVAGDGKLGFTSGTYDASHIGPGAQRVVEKGKYLCVWQKQPDGSWKAIRDMWNVDSK